MAIINTNEVILSDSELPLAMTMISAHTSEISNNSVESVKIRAQIGFFLSPEKMLQSPTNALKIQGFENNVLIFDYPTSDRNVFYFFDQRIKEYIMQCFPEWDADKLIITTTPIE
jgi:hypothetical protein